MATIGALAISPDARLLAFATDAGSIEADRFEMTWYVVPLDGSRPARAVADGGKVLMTTYGGHVGAPPVWAPNSKAIYFPALLDGQIQVWRAPVDGGGAMPLTADAANVRAVRMSADKASLVYTVDATRAAIEHAEREAFDEGTPGDGTADLAAPASRGTLFDGAPASRRLTGTWFNSSHLLWRTPSRDVAIPIPASDRADGRDSATALPASWTTTLQPPDYHASVTVTPPGQAAIRCTATPCVSRNVVAVTSVPGRSDYLVTGRDSADTDRLSLWDPATQRSRDVTTAEGALGGGDQYGSSCATTRDAAFCVTEGPSAPPTLERISLETGETRRLFDPNAALASRIDTPVRTIRWRDAGGGSHAAELVLPPGPAPKTGFPLVLTYYLCPGFLRGGEGGELPLIPLAQSGIATLCINRARSDPGHQDGPLSYRLAHRDILKVVGLLSDEGLIDRRRVGMWGFSFGAETLSEMLVHSHLLAAAASASGLPEEGLYWFQAMRGRDYARRMKSAFHLGSPDRDPVGWRRWSAADNVEAISAPLLLQLPEQEARMDMRLWQKLSNSRTPAELWMFANEPHTKVMPRHIAIAMERNLDWFRFWLTGAEDPAPRKRDQYVRWRALAKRWIGSDRRG